MGSRYRGSVSCFQDWRCMLSYCSTWLYRLREPFSLLPFIASEFCFIWIWNEVFVKWSFMEQSSAAVSCEWLRVSDSSLRFFWNVFIVYCWNWGSFVWLLLFCCMMSLLWWLENVWWCVFYDLAVISTACINSMIQSVAWNEASCVVSPVLLMCGSITSVVMTYIHTCISPEVCSLI